MRTEPINVGYLSFKAEESSAKREDTGVSTPEIKHKPISKNSLPLISAAVAIASLGVGIYAVKGKNNLKNKLDQIAKEAAESQYAKETAEKAKEAAEKAKNDAENKYQELQNSLNNKFDGLNNRVDSTESKLDRVTGALGQNSSSIANQYFARTVEVNGNYIDNIATPLRGYMSKQEQLEKQLRGEAFKRIFGIRNADKKPSQSPTIRIATSELSGFAKTGGLAIVPLELIANSGAIMNDKLDAELLVDMPMYIGQVENDVYFDLEPITTGENAGKVAYIRKDNNGKRVMANLHKVYEDTIPMIDGNIRTNESSEVYMSDIMYQPVAYEETLQQFPKKIGAKIREHIENGRVYDSKLVRFIPSREATLENYTDKYSDIILQADSDGNLDEVLKQFGQNAAIQLKTSLEDGQASLGETLQKFFQSEMANLTKIKQLHNKEINQNLRTNLMSVLDETIVENILKHTIQDIDKDSVSQSKLDSYYTNVDKALINAQDDNEFEKALASYPEKEAQTIREAKNHGSLDLIGAIGDAHNSMLEFVSRSISKPVLYSEEYSQFGTELANDLKTAFENRGSSPQAQTKYQAVFYKNRHFEMDGPIENERKKNIYSNVTQACGETMRFVYFNRLMGEYLTKGHRKSTVKPKADIIFANDWQTAMLPAYLRLGIPAQKACGLDPEIADKLYDTPVISIIHNAMYNGNIGDRSEIAQAMNVLFDEHAAIVAQNAWMPKDSGFPPYLGNGLFTAGNFNPQTMALAYSDNVVYVSDGNFRESSDESKMANLSNAPIAAMRGKVGRYADQNLLAGIARANGLDSTELPDKPTACGITNGCDKVNNIILDEKARYIETSLGLPVGAIATASQIDELGGSYAYHQHNKKVGLDVIKRDLNLARSSHGKNNPLKVRDFETTDLTGVDENTMIHGIAGRIENQKGFNIWIAGIKHYYENGEYDKENPPVFYMQGSGSQAIIQSFLDFKKELFKIDPKAASRLICAEVFSEPGRYDCCKMISDFSAMPSWDEPCGLVHKEIGYASGAISMVNKVGGLRDGLKDNVNSIFIDFRRVADYNNTQTQEYQDALKYNGEQWAKGFVRAEKLFKNKEEFKKGVDESLRADFSWLAGAMQRYTDIVVNDLGALPKNIDTKHD